MNELWTGVLTGLTAFAATNLDDIVLLLLLFSQVSVIFRRRHIVMGQYLGFGALVLASLPSFFGGMLMPSTWIGLLGLVPIAIGMSRLLHQDEDAMAGNETVRSSEENWLSSLLSPQTYSVAAVTFANGGDNIGIYVPLFASSTWESLVAILSVFFSLVGVWCYAACQLTRLPIITEGLTRYGNQLVPLVLIGLGVLILVDSHTLENRGLATLTLAISGLVLLVLLREGRTSLRETEVEDV